MMLTGNNPQLIILRQQFSEVRVLKREFTQTGFFSDLQVSPNIPRLQKRDRVTITDMSLKSSLLKYGAGFVLFVDDGVIGCLEGFTYGEEWPNPLVHFQLSYLMESPRGSGKHKSSNERDEGFGLKDLTHDLKD